MTMDYISTLKHVSIKNGDNKNEIYMLPKIRVADYVAKSRKKNYLSLGSWEQ